jgi:hypothetical protein
VTTFLVFVALLLGFMALGLWQQRVSYRREAFIREYTLPHGLFEQLRKKRPGLDLKQCQLVAHALRQFFLAHLKSGRRYVSMPSQVADDLWHEFILHTRHYEVFCRGAFGRFLHHTPAVAVRGGSAQAAAGLRRCWWQVCREEHINPKAPTRLPLLFALDAKLGIADGFVYALDCGALPRREGEVQGGASATHCGGELSTSCGPADGGAGNGSDGGGGDGDGGGGCGGGD